MAFDSKAGSFVQKNDDDDEQISQHDMEQQNYFVDRVADEENEMRSLSDEFKFLN